MVDQESGTGTHRLRLGILGAGMIATVDYGVLPGMQHISDKVEVVAIADPVVDRARNAASKFGIPNYYASLREMLDDPRVEAVANLTPIPLHAETSLEIVKRGKHLVSEKPLATTMRDADSIIAAASASGVVIVCSPPDLLFSQYSEARRLLKEDAIGKVAFARVQSSHAGPGGGPEDQAWPTDPTWFYQEGSGPLFDMGVYGIHQITGLLGAAKRVSAFSGITEPTRTVRGGPFKGTEMTVTANDNNLFMLDFGHSTFAVVDGTFNVHASRSPKVEIFARKGTMSIYKQGPKLLEIFRTDAAPGLDGWIEPSSWPRANNDHANRLKKAIMEEHLADCVRSGSRPILSAEHARHALEIMLAVSTSAVEGRVVDLATTF
ncbi:Gfo/Idh/MocA family oxidoreductase [Rhodoglobus aureus]|uniref:Gfo/Idh/MocA family oxidoreductase n=1 Tax=Rhodoglobus aureus TaxID=191497 RepID=A0ABN1VTV1_9MICO